jgi:hypothetical protein
MKLGETVVEAGESYPGANSFGVLGWSCPTLEAANERFRKLRE